MSAAPQPIWKVGDPAPEPLPRRSEADVMARWGDGPPLVSILCPTYQHVDFIEDALRGFLGQDTDFPFEIIVRDDASTDGTAEIVRDYVDQYPNIIRAVLETRNRYHEVPPLYELRQRAQSSLLAACEGDDYWIRPDKLAKQVHLLQGHPETSVVSHSAVAIRGDTVVIAPQRTGTEVITSQQLKMGHEMSARTMCFRGNYVEAPALERHMKASDRFLAARLGEIGAGVILRDLVGAVYRLHDGGVWSSRSRFEQGAMMAVTHYWIGHYFAAAGDVPMARYHVRRATERVAHSQLVHGVDPRPPLIGTFVAGWLRTAARRLIGRWMSGSQRD